MGAADQVLGRRIEESRENQLELEGHVDNCCSGKLLEPRKVAVVF